MKAARFQADSARYNQLKRILQKMIPSSVLKIELTEIKARNAEAAVRRDPIVKTAPLPSGAQFLNIIESVFSGMSRAIIHNSDYPSLEAAQQTIDTYFAKRNESF